MYSKIIVRMPNWLGDCVMALPVLEDLRQHYPQAHIAAQCLSGAAPVLENLPHIDEVITTTSKESYDLGVLLTNSLSSAWKFWKGNVGRRLGYAADMRSLLLTDAVSFPENRKTQHLVITYKMLLNCLGISVSETTPRIHITEEEKERCRKMLGTDKEIIVGINPGAAYGTAKCWLPERFREVTKLLLEDPRVCVVYVGDKSSEKLIADIVEGTSAVSLAGKTSLRELLATIKLCDVFLTNDSGPMHVAAALERPLVALFGSTSDIATGPYGGATVIHKHVDCSPCFKRECPADFKCMQSISTKEVYEAILKGF
jgi:heptosyltransferase II